MTRAIKKYGKDNFQKEVLFIFDTEEEMNQKEQELVTEELVNNPLCYNIMLGGEGGDTWTLSGKRHSNETKKKISERVRKHLKAESHEIRSNRQKDVWKRLKENPDKLKKINEKRAKTIKDGIAKGIIHRGHKLDEETRLKISKAMKAYQEKRKQN